MPDIPSDPHATTSLKASITAAWDGSAATYDDQWSHGIKTPAEHAAWLQLLARLVPPSPPLRVLDVGAGTGFVALLLAELGHEVVGIDLSEGMLDVARRAATTRGLDVTFAVGDAEAPSAELGRFDLVVSRHLLWTLLDPEAAIRAWAACAPGGGRVLAIDGFWFSSDPVDALFRQAGALLERLQGTAREHRGGYAPETKGRMPLQHVTTLDPVRNAFVRGGLTEVLAEELPGIDQVEREAAPLATRLRSRWRRYLVEGRTPA